MLKKLGLPIEMVEQAGVMLPVVTLECRYKVPAKLGDTLKIVSVIDTLPLAKLVIRNEIYNPAGQLVCEGSVTLGFIDSSTRRPVRCPAALTRIFEKHIK